MQNNIIIRQENIAWVNFDITNEQISLSFFLYVKEIEYLKRVDDWKRKIHI